MIERIWKAAVPIAWVVADTVSGGKLDLRGFLEAHAYPYVLAVACDEPVGILSPEGCRRQVEVREVAALLLHEQDGQRLWMSEGTKGERLFDWACVPILPQWEADGRHWVLLRRSLTDPREIAYSFVFGPAGTTLPEMVKAIGARWRIEEDFENAKDLGLDHYEVRRWIGWYRHVTKALLAQAFLVGVCVQDKARQPLKSPEETPQEAKPRLALTVAEVRHLLGHVLWPAPRSMQLLLSWSWWRRCHQSLASYYHTQRRLPAG